MTLAAVLDRFETTFVRLIDVGELTVPFVLGAFGIALVVGAAHALAPGHGKTLAAAYLVGARGRATDALALGGVVAIMHAGSVAVLGLGIHALTRTPVLGARVGPWMTLAAAVLVLLVGAGLLARQIRLRGRRAPIDHRHDPPAGVKPLSGRGVVLIGMSGGLLPSPSAFLVLATAVFVDRILFGLALVAAFSLGLAATLTVLGLAVLRGRDAVARRATDNPSLATVVGLLPLLSAVVIATAGVGLTTLAILRL